MTGSHIPGLPEDECISCHEPIEMNDCPKSLRPCGHHCNCSWTQDICHWCGQEFGEETGVESVLLEEATNT